LACAVACYTGATLADLGANTTGTGTAVSLATTTHASDSFIVTGFAHVGTGTWTSNVGSLRGKIAGAGVSTPGIAIVDNTGAVGSSVTTSATQTGSTAWAGISVQLETG